MATDVNHDPVLSELTSIVIVYPTSGQPIIKIMTIRISDVPAVFEEAAAATVPYTSDIKLSQTTELGIMCAPKPNRLRQSKVRVHSAAVAELAERLFSKYEIQP